MTHMEQVHCRCGNCASLVTDGSGEWLCDESGKSCEETLECPENVCENCHLPCKLS